MLTPYQFASNTPIQAIDLDGLEAFFIHGTNHGPDVWDSQLLTATQDLIFEMTNNFHADNNFSWRVNSTETATNWRGREKSRTNDLLNHQMNDDADRNEAAHLLVDYVLNFRTENNVSSEEPVTLIGYSHGGNVSIRAARILFEEHGLQSNLITINTPAYNDDGDAENPFRNPGINDMITLWTPGDGVAGGLTGDDHTPENAGDDGTLRNRVFDIEQRNEVRGPYNNHYLENVDPEQIEELGPIKLAPIEEN